MESFFLHERPEGFVFEKILNEEMRRQGLYPEQYVIQGWHVRDTGGVILTPNPHASLASAVRVYWDEGVRFEEHPERTFSNSWLFESFARIGAELIARSPEEYLRLYLEPTGFARVCGPELVTRANHQYAA